MYNYLVVSPAKLFIDRLLGSLYNLYNRDNTYRKRPPQIPRNSQLSGGKEYAGPSADPILSPPERKKHTPGDDVRKGDFSDFGLTGAWKLVRFRESEISEPPIRYGRDQCLPNVTGTAVKLCFTQREGMMSNCLLKLVPLRPVVLRNQAPEKYTV